MKKKPPKVGKKQLAEKLYKKYLKEIEAPLQIKTLYAGYSRKKKSAIRSNSQNFCYDLQ